MVIFLGFFFINFELFSLSGNDYLISTKVLKGDKVVHVIRLYLPQDIDEKLLTLELSKDIDDNAKLTSISRISDGNKFFTEVKIEYCFDKLGFVKIPPLKVIYRNEAYLSSEFEVSVLREDEMQSFGLPVGLYWDFDREEVYEYQSVGLVLRLSWLANSNLNTIAGSFNAIKDAMIDKTPIFENIKYRTFNSKEILDIPLYNFILTPLRGSRDIVIPSTAFNIDENMTRMSPEIFFKVKPIPDKVKSLAVGTFKIDYEFPNSTLISQDTFTILIKITGQGNLPHVRFPGIETYNSKIIYKKKNYNFEPSQNGYKGSISEIYTIKPDNKGNLFLNIGDFTYLDPEVGEVYKLDGERLKYEYDGEFKSSDNFTEDLFSDFSLLSYYDILNHKNKTFLIFVPVYYLMLIPGFLFSLAIFIKYRKFFIASGFGLVILTLTLGVSVNAINDGSFSRENINDLIESYESKDYNVALSKVDNIIKKNPSYSGLWLNRALILNKMERDFDAIYSAYKAFFTSPNNETFYRVINFIEAKNGINENIRNNSFAFSNVFFIISLILINIVVIALSCKFYAKNLKRIILFLICSVACFTLFQTYYFYVEQQSEIGIIKGDLVSLYKVPDNFSRSWRFLKGNVSVYVIDKKDDFILIKTSHGLQGWVHKNFIVSVKDDLI
ncbi:SH3 domain-containing protein [Candidatus Borreliella tachyglossi]|uniref:SH3 domain-containing protein n=1 Tax=Candidatus Borreliella tachyglossi TaxID=1964448 RepID=UPI0019012CF2|nr:SH3 domain-containing protein [Candidatus Borreliella tachyglossi]